jgi:hypothetical protein
VFDIREGRWRRRAPRNIAHLRHYYSYEEESGALVNVVDRSLTQVEGRGATLIRKLLVREQLDERDQIHLGLFVAQLALRTPRNEQRVKQFNRQMGDALIDKMLEEYRRDPALFERRRKSYEAKTGKPASFSIDDLDRRRPRVEANKAGVLGMMFLPLEPLLAGLLAMDWVFYFTPVDRHVVISDDPCEIAIPDGAAFNGMLTEGAELHVPLAKNLVLAAFDGDGTRSWGQLPVDAVARLNRRMARRAHRFIISSRKGFDGDEILHELIGDRQRCEKGWEHDVRLHPEVEKHLREVASSVTWKKDSE